MHAVCGVLGLTSFSLVHLWAGLGVLWGRGGFHTAYHVHEQRPTWFQLLMFAWVFAPLVVHGGYGLWLALGLLRPKADSEAAGELSEAQRRRRAIQGVTGCFILAFLLWHWASLTFPDGLLGGAATDSYDRLVALLSSTGLLGIPVAAGLYTLGSLVTLLHAAHGLWRSTLFRGLRERFPKHFARSVIAIFALTFIPVWVGVLHFATGLP